MLIGTRGLEYYPNYVIPINYYETENILYDRDSQGCYRLALIEDGKGSLFINDAKLTIQPLTILCLNDRDTVANIDCSCTRLQVLCFLPTAINNRLTLENVHSEEGLAISDSQDKLFLLPFLFHDETYTPMKYLDFETFTRLKDIIKSLKEQLLHQSDSWPCLTRSYILELLFLIERTYRIKKINLDNTPARFTADDILLYLHNNYWSKITISDLTKRFHTNQTTLSKEFKNATGMTIISYILKLRVIIAAGMLRDTLLNIDIIIERVGFHNITHFNKVFKEYHQCLPHEYRKRFHPYQ